MNEFTKELGELDGVEEITSIQFGLFDPDEIKKSSVCEVYKPETFDGPEPVPNGLFDSRMGVTDRGPECASCKNNNALCPGHHGHIELAVPVFYMHFISRVMKILPCICFKCSSLLINKKMAKMVKALNKKKGSDRLDIINSFCTKLPKPTSCCYGQKCRAIQPNKYQLLTSDKMRGIEKNIPNVEKDTIVAVVAELPEEAVSDANISRKQRVTAGDIYHIFRKISDEDCKFLGFNPILSRPEWMICRVLPVAPPCVRPSIQRDNNQRSEDDLTYVYTSIIKANNQLKKKIRDNDTERKINVAHDNLQWNIATLISNKIAGIPPNQQRSGKVIKAFQQRLTGKAGRLRKNLLGKRSDYSARTVIGVDPNISISEFCVPEKIATIVTYPEVVTIYNIEEMMKIVRNGPNAHPGATKIERTEYDCYGTPYPCFINLKHVDLNSINLSVGDIVHRHLKNGDIGLFNRQPSLHRMNMMAHKIRIIKGNTFGLNVSVTNPYNADFDGIMRTSIVCV